MDKDYDFLVEGNETLSSITVYADDGQSQDFTCSDLGLAEGCYTKKEWLKALEKNGYSALGMTSIE